MCSFCIVLSLPLSDTNTKRTKTMNTKPFANSTVTQPEKNKDGTWSFQEFPPMGGDIYHGDYLSRSTARKARAEVVSSVQDSGARAELAFARA